MVYGILERFKKEGEDVGALKEIIELAEEQVGTKENPRGSNNVKYNTWYYGREVSGNYPWCMAFIMWLFNEVGIFDIVPIKTASCTTLMLYANKFYVWVESDYQPGDVLIYDFQGDGKMDHTGICISATSTKVTAIEGNTSVNNASNGGEVRKMDRNISSVVGAWRPDYEEGDKMNYDTFKEFMNQYISERRDNDSSEYSKKAREYFVEKGIIQGGDPLPDGSPNYMWEDYTTKEQMITVAYRILEMVGVV